MNMNTCHPPAKSREQLTKLLTIVIIALTLFAVPAMSQLNTFPTSGNAGIGTTVPLSPLHVKGAGAADGSIRYNTIIESTEGPTSGNGIAGIAFRDVFTGTTPAILGGITIGKENTTDGNFSSYLALHTRSNGGQNTEALRIDHSGNVGIGTTAPGNPLTVQGTQRAPSLSDGNGYVVFLAPGGYSHLQIGGDSASPYGTWLQVNNGSGYSQPLLLNPLGGNVGIGTTTPTVALDVNGDVNVSGNIAAKYQDVAEWVPATETMEPGTVVVLNPERSNEVMPATRAYDTTVAGVVSTNPGLILGEKAESKAQIATSGRVRVKVSATGQPIHIGDLLVTSEKSGEAMKSEPMKIAGRSFHQPGTIIGKALEPLASGEGEILVLLSLQ